ncbi:MAG: DUF2057 domain-containing protein [Oceanospirillaceae bacterium]|nr:DUF2057 domain-containing protein [Oceanospirillaceae bacterium]
MKKTLCALFVSLLGFSSSVVADVQVQFEDGISVLALNGKEVTNESLFSGTDFVKLNDGLNQLVVQYTAELKKSADDFELETTDSFVLLFDVKNIALVLKAPLIRNEDDVDTFNRRGDWRLLDVRGVAQVVKVSSLKKDGFQLSRDYERELEEFNLTDAAAALPYERVEGLVAESPLPAVKSQAGNNKQSQSSELNMPEKMLRYWYNQADSETRKRFKQWIGQ